MGTALPWVIVSLGGLAAAFLMFTEDWQRKFDLAIAWTVLTLIDFGVMPMSSASVGIFSISGLVVAASIATYIFYIIRVLKIQIGSKKERRNPRKIITIAIPSGLIPTTFRFRAVKLTSILYATVS